MKSVPMKYRSVIIAQVYPDAEALKTTAHLRDDGVRPYIELQPTDHPLAIEQRDGISVDRLAEIYAAYTH
jgi:hypothetical protein